MIDETTIERIIELNKEVKKLVKEDTPPGRTVKTLTSYHEDVFIKNLNERLIRKALLEGLHLEDGDLYPDNPDKKHQGKNYYCILKYKEQLLYVRYLLISYLKRPLHITLFHTSPLNYGSGEQRRYEEIVAALKNFTTK